eukprot:TRINITY_DN89513_c0_g1_i1.p1 TRINITY_DN89513_c0_g1~~TRINITY_DN89513_c0_g1_i1.p1  ORF type:complete len:336 (-),score=76.62 TRINITY_DN89513_c0_g1_i1:165-1172(-)
MASSSYAPSMSASYLPPFGTSATLPTVPWAAGAAGPSWSEAAPVPLSPMPGSRSFSLQPCPYLGNGGALASGGTLVPRPIPMVNGGGPCLGQPGPQGAAMPPSLTSDMPDPTAISRQKDNYMKMLEQQLQQSISVLDQRVKYQRDALQIQHEQQKKQLLMQLDQNIKAQDMALTQQYSEQLMSLQLQNTSHKAALEQQAMQLSMDYEQRKAEEDLYRAQYEMQKQHEQAAEMLREEHQRVLSPPDHRFEDETHGGNEVILSAGYTPASRTLVGLAGAAPPSLLQTSPLAPSQQQQLVYPRSVSPLPLPTSSMRSISPAPLAQTIGYYNSLPAAIR